MFSPIILLVDRETVFVATLLGEGTTCFASQSKLRTRSSCAGEIMRVPQLGDFECDPPTANPQVFERTVKMCTGLHKGQAPRFSPGVKHQKKVDFVFGRFEAFGPY